MTVPPFFEPGHRAEIGSHEFTREKIIRFAAKFDPQPFHLDEEKAATSMLGGLCASGWHTTAVWMRLMRDYTAREIDRWTSAGNPAYEIGPSPGFANLRWIRPVFVDDIITYHSVTETQRPMASRPGWHVFSGRQEGINQDGKPVLSFQSTGFMRYPAD